MSSNFEEVKDNLNQSMENNDDLLLEYIMSKDIINDEEYYQIKWKDIEEPQWVPLSKLQDHLWMIEQFNEEIQDQIEDEEEEIMKENQDIQILDSNNESYQEGQNPSNQSQQKSINLDDTQSKSSQHNQGSQQQIPQVFTTQPMNIQQLIMKKRFEEQQKLESMTSEQQQIHQMQTLEEMRNNLGRKRFKKSRDYKYQQTVNNPHDLLTDQQIINQQFAKRIDQLDNSAGSRLDQDAAQVANNAHNISYNKSISTFTNLPQGVIVPQMNPIYQIQEPLRQNFELSKLPKNGTFETDRAVSISSARIQQGKMLCTVQWEKRPNGITPDETIYTNTDVKKYNPLILIDYYEKVCKIRSTAENID